MIELHLHLDGSLEPENITELSDICGEWLPSRDTETLRGLLTVSKNCRDLGEYLEKFELPLTVLQTKECITRAVYLLAGRLHRQGIIYAEIRFAPGLHTRKGLTQHEVVAAAIDGLARVMRECFFPAQLILCCMRGADMYVNLETVKVAGEYFGRGVCALDIAGNEADYPVEEYAALFEEAKKLGIPFTVHAGEAAGAQSVKAALELGAVRIGHGVRSVEDDEVLEMLRSRGTVLESCFTSNIQTRAVEFAEKYPLKRFLDMGIKATVCTDNSTVSGTDLRREYQLCATLLNLTDEELITIAENALNGAFISDEEKAYLWEKLHSEFPEWIRHIEEKR